MKVIYFRSLVVSFLRKGFTYSNAKLKLEQANALSCCPLKYCLKISYFSYPPSFAWEKMSLTWPAQVG